MAQSEYSGIGRLALFLWSALLYPVLAVGIIAALFVAADHSVGVSGDRMNALWNVYGGVVYLAVIFAMIALQVLRLRNLGMSGWWVLAKWVPILNLWILWRMFACPVGYADHHQLDLVGKILSLLLLVIFVLPLLLAILGALI